MVSPHTKGGSVIEHRIHGPPGCGKTTTLAAWVEKAAQRYGSEHVVVCSFTRAAAAEVVGRHVPLPRQNVGTLHSMCFRALGSPEIAEGHLNEWNEQNPELRISEGARVSIDEDDPWTERVGAESDRVYRSYQVLRAQMTDVSKWPDDVLAFHARWFEWKIRNDFYDFTDLLERADEEIPTCPGDPKVCFVDEAQDLDPLQFAVVRHWAERMEFLVCAGDADQSIYRFKGSSPRSFIGVPIPEERNKVLDQSYRMPASVQRLASAWIQRCSFRYPTTVKPRNEEGDVEVLEAPFSVGDAIAQRADEATKQGSVMIITSCGFQLQQVCAALRRAGLPFHNPYRTTNGAWNPMRGGVERLRALLSARDCTDGFTRWNVRDVRRWVELLDSKTCLKQGAKSYIKSLEEEEEAGTDTTLFGTPRGVLLEELRSWIDPDRFAEFSAAIKNPDPIHLVDWYDRMVLASQRKLIDFACSLVRLRGQSALSEDPKICVGTIHSVKGGEADTVILSPDISPNGHNEWNEPGDARDSVLRLFYVGITRARQRLIITRPTSWRSVDLIHSYHDTKK